VPERIRARQRQKVYRKLGLEVDLKWCVAHSDYTPKKARRMHVSTYQALLRRLDRHR
jgi:hypothetical protein